MGAFAIKCIPRHIGRVSHHIRGGIWCGYIVWVYGVDNDYPSNDIVKFHHMMTNVVRGIDYTGKIPQIMDRVELLCLPVTQRSSVITPELAVAQTSLCDRKDGLTRKKGCKGQNLGKKTTRNERIARAVV